MAQVGSSLNGIAASLKLLELPGMPSKGDVSDWLVKFTDTETAAERLGIMVEKAEPYEPPKKATMEDAILDDSTLEMVELPQKMTILAPWLTEGSITLAPSWRGFGKTWFGMGLVDAITRGVSFGPWNCAGSFTCLYLGGDLSIVLTQLRSNSCINGNGLYDLDK